MKRIFTITTFSILLIMLFSSLSSGQTMWTKHSGNPVLDVGPAGSWEDEAVSHPRVLFDGTTYRMWYSGFDGNNIRIGHATSPNGITWTKAVENPVLDVGPPGSWEAVWVENSMVLFDGTSFQMWYHGLDANGVFSIGIATSSDGINWVKYSGNPTMIRSGIPGTWNSDGVLTPWVIRDGTSYHMWYGGYDGSKYTTGYAHSTDGITWVEHHQNPVLDVGPPGSWDAEWSLAPSVVIDGSNYHMWYHGTGSGLPILIGYATSPDSVDWTKHLSNPVLALGAPGTWESTWVLVHPYYCETA